MRFNNLRTKAILLAVAVGVTPQLSADTSDYANCLKLLETQYRGAHKIESCLAAVEAGHPEIQYAVGMSYGYAKMHEEELMLYKSAANQGFVPAYLALGHTMRSVPYKDPISAIEWYKKYIEAEGEGYGYAALQVSKLYNEIGEQEESEKWYGVCERSDYAGCK